MIKRVALWLATVYLLGIVWGIATPVQAQTLNAQIQQFWNQLRTGVLAFSTLHLNASSYANWGTTVGANGYGIRDSAGTMQAKNSGGSWVNIAPSGGSAPADATYYVQTATSGLSNEIAIGLGAVSNFLVGGATPAYGNTLTFTALGSTSTDGFVLTNTTASTNGITQQISPRIRLVGTAWNSSAGMSEVDGWLIENRPNTVAGTTTSQLYFASSTAGGAFSDKCSILSSTGTLNCTNVTGATSVLGTSQVNIGSGGAFRSNGNGTNITMPADGQINFNNNGVSAGVGWDVTTDAVAKLRVRAQNAYATMDALAYRASTTPITSGTTFLTSGSGMAVANVGANSCGTTAATITGNNNTFEIIVGATSGTQCRVAFTIAATTKWSCTANDSTTTVAVRTTPVDTTHTDFIGTFTAGDTITGICFPR